MVVISNYDLFVKTVKISELKALLSTHLQRVRLIIRSALLGPHKRSSAPWPNPPGNVPDEIIETIWREEPEGR
jgi:hypothetical protein